jgi:hypothetical protein
MESLTEIESLKKQNKTQKKRKKNHHNDKDEDDEDENNWPVTFHIILKTRKLKKKS